MWGNRLGWWLLSSRKVLRKYANHMFKYFTCAIKTLVAYSSNVYMYIYIPVDDKYLFCLWTWKYPGPLSELKLFGNSIKPRTENNCRIFKFLSIIYWCINFYYTIRHFFISLIAKVKVPETRGRFVVKSLEKHLDYIDFF